MDLEKIASELAADPTFMAEASKKTQAATSTAMDMIMSGMSADDVIGIMRGTFLNSVIEDKGEKL